MTTEEYNKEPVEYCTICGGLHIITNAEGDAECQHCSSVNCTNFTDIEHWQELYGSKKV